VQAFSAKYSWLPPTGTLGDLTIASIERAASAVSSLNELRARAMDQAPALPFASNLRGRSIKVIGEVKRASPSKGAIAPGLDAATQAAHYVAGGAAAISVLTEPSRFGGSLTDLEKVSASVGVPVIRKDFIVAPVQLWEARAAGASAALLIVRALAPAVLQSLIEASHEIGIATLVEVRDEAELDLALEVGATVIGVNNRNLETLVIDPTTAPALIPRIPVSCIAVAESGMQRVEDVRASADAGADAILVGSAISAATDPAAAVAALAVVPRRDR